MPLLQATDELKKLLCSLRSEQEDEILLLIKECWPQHFKRWVAPEIINADGTVEAACEVVIDDLDEAIVKRLCDILRCRVVPRTSCSSRDTINYVCGLPLEYVLSNPILAEQRTDKPDPPREIQSGDILDSFFDITGHFDELTDVDAKLKAILTDWERRGVLQPFESSQPMDVDSVRASRTSWHHKRGKDGTL